MIGVVGAGAFGTSLAVVLGREGREVALWARDRDAVDAMQRSRENARSLPDTILPPSIMVTHQLGVMTDAAAVLLALPMQSLRGFLAQGAGFLNGRDLVACCKGIDLETLLGPVSILHEACPDSTCAILTGPSFAADIARGLPTALTLAGTTKTVDLQHLLSTPVLRLYRTDDVKGAEFGGAFKNVIAIAAGVVIGAGLGESARAALITRGYAEMMRLAVHLGGRPETLAGLSGLGDLILTCTSAQSRNFRFGLAVGGRADFDAAVTVEGIATAKAVSNLAKLHGIAVPIADMVVALIDRTIPLGEAIRTLMSRPLKQE
jgi:glycerol-3-phosphate dehydrogenase (NAD(P)+)